jgi:hypothetical protein
MPRPSGPLVTAIKPKDEEGFHTVTVSLLFILKEYILKNISLLPWTIAMHVFRT